MKGKKIACFLALPHHTRFFLPLREEIKKQGGDLLFITPLADYPYEIDMMKKGLTFRYFVDYKTPEVRDKVDTSTMKFFDDWARMCFKWEGFSRWPLFKQTWLLGELAEEYFCMEKFIEVEKPDMFIAHHECARWGKIIGHLSLKNKIPFVTFQEGDYYARTLGNAVHTEYSTADLLWGNVTKKRLTGYTCSPDKMLTIGNTHIDGAMKVYNKHTMIESIRQELGIPSGKKVILFLVGVKYGGIKEKDIWHGLLQGLHDMDKDVVCIFKWHPNVARKTVDDITEIIKGLHPSVIILVDYEPYRLIAISDYCIILGQTTLAIEAIAFGKPVFSIPDPDTMDDPYVDMRVAQTAFPIGNWSNLFNTMSKGMPADIQSGIDNFIADNFYKLDGKTVERAIGVMSYIFNVRERKKKSSDVEHQAFTEGRVSFVIPSGDDAEALLATLTSLSQNVKYNDWEVVLVANNENVIQLLGDISGDLKIVTEKNSGLGKLYNEGAKNASGEFLIFMRPGIVYFKDQGLVKNMDGAICGVAIKNPDMSPYCFGIGYDFNSTPYRIEDQSRQPDSVGGGFIAMRRVVFEALGGFDEEVANHLVEPDICLKAKEPGIPVQYLSECLVFNYRETFFGEDVSEENWKNRVKFFAKWIGTIPKSDDFLYFAKDIMKV
ncbi:MAG: glycosyltransferase [Nitrospirae bacterium]|nr:glycosyltransferase [Nitrospirota bacterium]